MKCMFVNFIFNILCKIKQETRLFGVGQEGQLRQYKIYTVVESKDFSQVEEVMCRFYEIFSRDTW